YKRRVARLTEEGRMEQAGLESVAAAKQSGLWTFLDDVDQLIVPDDLTAELRKHDTAEAFFDNTNDSSKRFVLRWIKLAKTDKTRNKRIAEIARLSARGEKLKGS
ncbi:MAG: YdeI/OmpD-associated family protein, partial [Lewinella sp.]